MVAGEMLGEDIWLKLESILDFIDKRISTESWSDLFKDIFHVK